MSTVGASATMCPEGAVTAVPVSLVVRYYGRGGVMEMTASVCLARFLLFSTVVFEV